MFPDTSSKSRFSLDLDGRYVGDSAFILPTADYFLLGILNSSSVWFYLKQVCAAFGDTQSTGRLRLKKQYLELLPIPQASEIHREDVRNLVVQLLATPKDEALQVELDKVVSSLYFKGVDPS